MEIVRKRVLLSTHSLVELAGAELNIHALALEFLKNNFYVEVATFRYDDPIKSAFEKDNILVKNILVEKPSYRSYDLIWAQHTPTLYKLLFDHLIEGEKIVFSSLSPFEPLEVPPVFVNKLSLCLANSYETRDQLLRENVEQEKLMVFPNYAPEEYTRSVYKAPVTLRNICIVSNHVPEELEAATQILVTNDINIDIYGIRHTQKLVTPELLLNYDAVITIGKTVQFALVMGMPVYCYDIHGGPGWLNSENYINAKYHNFSGRGFNRKLTSEQLAKDIVEGFMEAVSFFEGYSNFARDEFDLNKNLLKVLDAIELLPSVECNILYKNYYYLDRVNKAFLREYEYKHYYKKEMDILVLKENEWELEEAKLQEENKKLTEQITHMENSLIEEINFIKSENEKEKEKNRELVEEIKSIRSSINGYENSLAKLNNEYREYKTKIERELQQKEKNCIYLSELAEERNEIIVTMKNTKVWKSAEFFRKIRMKALKVLKNPQLIVKKMRKKGSDFSTAVKVERTSFESPLDHPLVSVVIPIYDRTDVLIESIESILNQTYQNLELLLVCDGSPEKTLEIVRGYENNPRVRCFYFLNNSGNAVRGRNKAIKEARGEFLAFQDSDDVAEPRRLEISLNYAKEHNADVIYGGWRAIIDGSREVGLKDKQEIFSPDCDYKFLQEICVPCQSTVMVKTEALRHVGGLKTIMRYREDHELWLRLSYYGYKFKAVPEVLTNLRLHANNLELSFKDNDDHWKNITMVEHKIIRPLKPKIAYLVAGCGISGGLAVILNHLNGLLLRGYDVSLITEDKCEKIDWFPNQMVPIIPIDRVPDNLDIVVATYWTTAYTLDNIPSKSKYYFVQSDESKFFEPGSRESSAAYDSYKKSYTLITMANWIKEWLKNEFNKEAVYVPNGINLSIMHPEAPLMEKTGKLRVLLEGPINAPFKRMKEAFEVVRDLDCEVWCVSTGGSPDPEWRCDRFFDSVPMEKMSAIYSSCDVLLKMSSVESFCLPALEMMACGGTVVLNRFNGLEEFVVDGYNGLVVDLGDVDAAKSAINKLINDRELLRALSNNALATAQTWSWDRSIDVLESTFYQINESFSKEEAV